MLSLSPLRERVGVRGRRGEGFNLVIAPDVSLHFGF